MTGSILASVNLLPPFACYAIGGHGAHNHKRTLAQLVKRSGLSERTFVRILRAKSWANIKVGKMDAFARGCGVDLVRPARGRAYLERTIKEAKKSLPHLKPQQKRWIFEMIAEMVAEKKSASKA